MTGDPVSGRSTSIIHGTSRSSFYDVVSGQIHVEDLGPFSCGGKNLWK